MSHPRPRRARVAVRALPVVGAGFAVVLLGAPAYADGPSPAATAAASPSASAPSSASASPSAAPTRTAAPSLTVSADRSTVEYGDRLGYTLTATVAADSTDVVVTDGLPAGTSYVDGSAHGPAGVSPSYDAASRTLRFPLGALAAGSTATLGFQVVVDRPAPNADGSIPAAVIDDAASLTAAGGPTVSSNHARTPVTAVLGVTIVRRPPAADRTPAATTPAAAPGAAAAAPVAAAAATSQLPFTGLPTGPALAVAAGLIGAGSVLTAAGRRRRA